MHQEAEVYNILQNYTVASRCLLFGINFLNTTVKLSQKVEQLICMCCGTKCVTSNKYPHETSLCSKLVSPSPKGQPRGTVPANSCQRPGYARSPPSIGPMKSPREKVEERMPKAFRLSLTRKALAKLRRGLEGSLPARRDGWIPSPLN